MKSHKRKLFAILTAIIWFSGCQKQEDEPAGLKKSIPKTDSSSSAGIERSEDKGTALQFKCRGDSAVTLFDDTSDTDRYIKHESIDSLHLGAGHFVARHFYEGYDWIFISKACCAITELFGPVTFSPSKSFYASVSNDNEAGFRENGVQIISVNDGYASIELQDKMTTYAGESWSWADDSTFSMKIQDLNGNQKLRTYAFREGTWQIKNE